MAIDMREIKFRVWNKEYKKMFYQEHQEEEMIAIWFKYRDDYILMQYTGLKDKNGKEIYEGDIVRNEADRDIYHEIIWSEYHACWCVGDEDSHPINKYRLKDFWEVIGNIHENPELLENGEL